MNKNIIVKNVDVNLLRQQRNYLLQTDITDELEGLINLLDYMLDVAENELEDPYEDFLMTVTSGLEDTTLTPKEIAEYMEKHNDMPDGVYLIEALEDTSPYQLIEGMLWKVSWATIIP